MSVDVSQDDGRNDRKGGVHRTALLLAGVALMVYATFIVASILRS